MLKPLGGDRFASGVDQRRSGAASPGTFGLGLTRDRSRGLSTQTVTTAFDLSLVTVAAVGGGVGPAAADEPADGPALSAEEAANQQSAAMFGALMGQVAKKTEAAPLTEEEELWRLVHRSAAGPAAGTAGAATTPAGEEGDGVADLGTATAVELLAALGAISLGKSVAMQKLLAHPPLREALAGVAAGEDGAITSTEWVAFCEALRDLAKWNEFDM